MSIELSIAMRYLRSKRKRAIIGVVTVISVLGVAAGTASLIIALAINNGFRQDLQQRLLGASAHVSLMRPANDGIRDYVDLTAKLEKQPHVVAASSALYEQVLVSNGSRARGIVLKGVLPVREKRISDILDHVTFGSSSALDASQNTDGPAPIILGKEIADDLGVTVGSAVMVTSPQGEVTPFGTVPKYVRFKVAGIFESGFYDYDNGWAYVRLHDAQRLFGLGDVVSIIEFRLDDMDQARIVAQSIEQAAGRGFQTTQWMDEHKAIFRALKLERVVTFITIGLIVMVAALNILISLSMMVMEKTRDIAVLLSLGARRAQIRRIFVLSGAVLGASGTFLGLILGYGLSWLGGHYRLIALSPEVYAMDHVPFSPRLSDAFLVVAMAMLVSLLATLYPSRNAASVLPAEALRYE
jgi:lipoprotein-releasing system permease protein